MQGRTGDRRLRQQVCHEALGFVWLRTIGGRRPGRRQRTSGGGLDAFVDALDLAELGFEGVEPEATGRPSYHPAVLLKLYVYGYLNRVQSSRRLEWEAGRNVEVMWLLGRLVPDHKTIADFRKDNGRAIRKVCARFVELCREMGLLAKASVAIDGSKFKAVNNRDRNFTRAKMERRRAQLEESVARFLQPARHRRPAGAIRGARRPRPRGSRTSSPSSRERCGASKVSRRGCSAPRSADLAHRSRFPLDGDERARLRRRRLQRAGRSRHRASSDRRARGDQCRYRTAPSSRRGQGNQGDAANGQLEVVADRGYFSGEEILACEQAGITVRCRSR